MAIADGAQVIWHILLVIDMSNSSNTGDSISDSALHLQSLYSSWKKIQRQAEQFYQWLCYLQNVHTSSRKRKWQQSSNISFLSMIMTSESNFCEPNNIISGGFTQS